MSKGSAASSWQRAIVVLTYTVVAVVIVMCLHWAQAAFIPVVLAVFLTLILTPLVTSLGQVGVPRTPAVVLSVVLAACLVSAIGWIFTRQFIQLTADLPQYTENIKAKVRTLKEFATGPATGRVGKLVDDRSPVDLGNTL